MSDINQIMDLYSSFEYWDPEVPWVYFDRDVNMGPECPIIFGEEIAFYKTNHREALEELSKYDFDCDDSGLTNLYSSKVVRNGTKSADEVMIDLFFDFIYGKISWMILAKLMFNTFEEVSVESIEKMIILLRGIRGTDNPEEYRILWLMQI